MLKTEQRNPGTYHIDRIDAHEMVQLMQEANREAVAAIDAELDAIAHAIEAISTRMRAGGRLLYIGCGTSGRLGVLDASECPPTYGVAPERVVGIIAGGDGALRRASEGAEDNEAAGIADLSALAPTAADSVIGISAAGAAPYVLGALRRAKEAGALTVALTANADTPLEHLADITIHPDTGPEIITGSTRMKAGSAHKMILNMISTGVMVRQGYVYENLMIHLRPTNRKLRQRMIGITAELAACTPEEAEARLERGAWDIRRAIE